MSRDGRQNVDETLIRNSEIATNYTRFRNLRFGMAAIETVWGGHAELKRVRKINSPWPGSLCTRGGGEIAFRPKVTLFEANNAFVSERNVTSIMHCIICPGFDPYLAVALHGTHRVSDFSFPQHGSFNLLKTFTPELFPNERWIANESYPRYKYDSRDPSLEGSSLPPSNHLPFRKNVARGSRTEQAFRRWGALLI